MFLEQAALNPVLAEVSNLWVWALIAAVIVIALLLPRRLAKRSRILDDPKHKRTAQEELRHSMDRLLVELQETSRDINATIDTKMIALNRLIQEADARIEALEDLQAGEGGSPGRAGSPQVVPAQEVTPPPEETEPDTAETKKRRELEREIYRLTDEGKTELEIARLTNTPRGEVELVLSLRKTSDDETRAEDGAAS